MSFFKLFPPQRQGRSLADLRPMLAAYRNFFSLFFDFDVCRFCTSKRRFGYFSSPIGDASFGRRFGSWLRKKQVSVEKFWEAPWSTKTKHVLVNPKRFTKTFDSWLSPQYCWVCLYSKPLFKSICSTQTPTLAPHYPIIQLKMSSMFPPAASSSLPLPICLRAPPAIPSLGDCFPRGSIDLCKYVLYSSALRQRARWRTSLALSFGGNARGRRRTGERGRHGGLCQ